MNKATRNYYKPDVPLADDPLPQVKVHSVFDQALGRFVTTIDRLPLDELLCHCGEPEGVHGLGGAEHSFRPMLDEAQDYALFTARLLANLESNVTGDSPRAPRSFKQWKELGRVVKRGERAVRRGPDGVPLFEHDQTKPLTAAGHYDSELRNVAHRGAAKLIKRLARTYQKPADPEPIYGSRPCCSGIGGCICGEYDLPPGISLGM